MLRDKNSQNIEKKKKDIKDIKEKKEKDRGNKEKSKSIKNKKKREEEAFLISKKRKGREVTVGVDQRKNIRKNTKVNIKSINMIIEIIFNIFMVNIKFNNDASEIQALY